MKKRKLTRVNINLFQNLYETVMYMNGMYMNAYTFK